MRYLLLAPLAALLALAPGAEAAALKAKPTYAVKSAAVSGKSVKFVLTVAFAANAGKCPKEKIAASSGTGSTKKIWGTKHYTLDSDVCTAAIHGKLAKSKYGKSVKFKFSFPGGKTVKKFSGSKTLKLVTPPAPVPGPSPPTFEVGPQAFGKWRAEDPLDTNHQFLFTIKSPDHAVPGITSWLGGYTVMNCGASYEAQHVNFNWNQAFSLVGPIGKAVYTDNVGFAHDLTYTLNFSFANATQGSGSMTALGGYEVEPNVVKTCAASFNFTLNWAGPEF